MAKKPFARRYAQAVFEIALAKNELDRWLSDLGSIAALAEVRELVVWLESPRVHYGDKVKLLKAQLADVSPLAMNLVYLLLSRGIFSVASGVAIEYQRLLNGYRGIEEAKVVTAVPLDDEDKRRLQERLSAVTGKKVTVSSTVDASLLGGVVARVGGKLLDGSTRSRLQALKQKMER